MASKKKRGRRRPPRHHFVLYISENEKAKIKEDAAKNYRSMSAHVRYIINLYHEESNGKGEN